MYHFNPIEHLWDVVKPEILIIDVQLTNLQLCDVTMDQTKNVFPAPCKSYEATNEGGSEGKRGVRPSVSKVYPVKYLLRLSLCGGGCSLPKTSEVILYWSLSQLLLPTALKKEKKVISTPACHFSPLYRIKQEAKSILVDESNGQMLHMYFKQLFPGLKLQSHK